MSTIDVSQVLHCILIELQHMNDVDVLILKGSCLDSDDMEKLDELTRSRETKYKNINMQRWK